MGLHVRTTLGPLGKSKVVNTKHAHVISLRLAPSSAPEPSGTTMSSAEHIHTEPRPTARAAHPFRVYGYRVTHEWVWKFERDHNLEKPGTSGDTLESAVFLFLMFRLPGLQRHFIDDPSDTRFGCSHCLLIANNWNPKKMPTVASRLEQWKTTLGTEGQPRWYRPIGYKASRGYATLAAFPSFLDDLQSLCVDM